MKSYIKWNTLQDISGAGMSVIGVAIKWMMGWLQLKNSRNGLGKEGAYVVSGQGWGKEDEEQVQNV